MECLSLIAVDFVIPTEWRKKWKKLNFITNLNIHLNVSLKFKEEDTDLYSSKTN